MNEIAAGVFVAVITIVCWGTVIAICWFAFGRIDAPVQRWIQRERQRARDHLSPRPRDR